MKDYNEGMTSNNTLSNGDKTMTETRTIKWTAGSHEIEITMVAQPALSMRSTRTTSKRLELNIDTAVDGKSLGGMARMETIDHPKCVAKITNGSTAVGLTQDNLDRYNAARSELAKIVAKHNASYEAHEAELGAIDDDAKRIASIA